MNPYRHLQLANNHQVSHRLSQDSNETSYTRISVDSSDAVFGREGSHAVQAVSCVSVDLF